MIGVRFMQLVMEAEEEYEALNDRERKRRKCSWVGKWPSPGRRPAVGHYHQVMAELSLDDHRSV